MNKTPDDRHLLISSSPAVFMMGAVMLLGAAPAFSQEDSAAPPSIDELFRGPVAAEAGAAADEGLATPPATADAAVERPSPAPSDAAKKPGVAASRNDVPPETLTIAERGGLAGVGLVFAGKVGGGLGSVFLEGLGATPTVELEIGYDLPRALPAGRDLELFAALGYSAPSTTATVAAADPRLPADGSFDYTLTLHQLSATYGALYRFPINSVEWWRLYAAAGARTIWSWTVVAGAANGEAFSPYTESAFDLGIYAAVGSDFYVGPGTVLVEMQTAMSWPDRFVLRSTSTTALQLAVGYRFFL